MARVVAVFDDLLLGSNVSGMLRAAGHEVVVAGTADKAHDAAAGADLAVVDLGAGSFDGVAVGAALPVPRRLGVYSHVDAQTRARALEAGFDQAVPRSRLAREGADLVARLLGP